MINNSVNQNKVNKNRFLAILLVFSLILPQAGTASTMYDKPLILWFECVRIEGKPYAELLFENDNDVGISIDIRNNSGGLLDTVPVWRNNQQAVDVPVKNLTALNFTYSVDGKAFASETRTLPHNCQQTTRPPRESSFVKPEPEPSKYAVLTSVRDVIVKLNCTAGNANLSVKEIGGVEKRVDIMRVWVSDLEVEKRNFVLGPREENISFGFGLTEDTPIVAELQVEGVRKLDEYVVQSSCILHPPPLKTSRATLASVGNTNLYETCNDGAIVIAMNSTGGKNRSADINIDVEGVGKWNQQGMLVTNNMAGGLVSGRIRSVTKVSTALAVDGVNATDERYITPSCTVLTPLVRLNLTQSPLPTPTPTPAPIQTQTPKPTSTQIPPPITPTPMAPEAPGIPWFGIILAAAIFAIIILLVIAIKKRL